MCVPRIKVNISHLHGDADVLWRAGGRSGFHLQNLADPSVHLPRAWTEQGEGNGLAVMLREETRAWPMKFHAAPESTRAVQTTPEGQPASEIETRKGLVENNEEILMPSLGDR